MISAAPKVPQGQRPSFAMVYRYTRLNEVAVRAVIYSAVCADVAVRGVAVRQLWVNERVSAPTWMSSWLETRTQEFGSLLFNPSSSIFSWVFSLCALPYRDAHRHVIQTTNHSQSIRCAFHQCIVCSQRACTVHASGDSRSSATAEGHRQRPTGICIQQKPHTFQCAWCCEISGSSRIASLLLISALIAALMACR